MKYIASTTLAILVLGLGTLNIEHHLNLPKVTTTNVESHYNVSNKFPFIGKTYDVILKSEIKTQEEFMYLLDILHNASKTDTVIFHIAGYGGDGQTMDVLINNIKTTKAHTIMIVEGPSYSAHAFLAVSGDELLMREYSFLMFHTVSLYGFDCSVIPGLDRTRPVSEKCEQMMTAIIDESNRLIDSIAFLTLEEKENLKTGYDVYITSHEYWERTKANKRK